MGIFRKLTLEEKNTLLLLAREAVTAAAQGRAPSSLLPTAGALSVGAGAFVTLKQAGKLRGCIGNFGADRPLARTVQEMARAAALEDPRFPQVTPKEVPGLQIEISVLSGLTPITPEKVQVGTHGLSLSLGLHRGVFLPQVPVEWGWDRLEYLDQLCLKAGLPKRTWREPEVLLESFTAQVFHENRE